MMDYFETFQDEILYIWPDKLGAGTVLFLTSRYITVLRLPLEILPWFPTGARPSLKVCQACYNSAFAFTIVGTITTTFSLVLCAHALLGARKRYLGVILFVTSAFFIAAIGTSAKYMFSARWIVSDVPWLTPCSFESEEYLIGINAYLAVSREALLAVLMASTIYVRYMGQKGSLVNVMRRDVGFYFSVLVVLGVLHAIFRSPGTPVRDKYNVITALRMVLYPIMANRVLLNIRKTRDWRIKTNVISTLLFAPTASNAESESDQSIESSIFVPSDTIDISVR
ncbi:hypothetical protein FA13DRAFT_1818331 [Coprinellus micaceus]|uniref:DUF6533 domain-containing protein n=1 Tax=Coprinellus micaceus TaxID=71717 RepID=A0A4Y7SQY6_COPMI|nr:hypothetical protein FA13DRAFT_1818331 [Coprinellus micaceus]